ncbi:MAG: glycosyltransferase family A protein [Anaerolineales bacterium]|jgi:glycosyltransferase involved in cell wall biosynthesis
MDKKSLVSVVIIFYNAEKFIEESVESVLSQTYEHWELLLVVDGSSDASKAITQRFANHHPDRVRCLEHPGHLNQGKGAARNLGIYYARGEYCLIRCR